MTRRETRDALAGMSGGEPDSIARAVGLRERTADASPLSGTTVALVRIATLIALGCPARLLRAPGRDGTRGRRERRGHPGRPARGRPAGRHRSRGCGRPGTDARARDDAPGRRGDMRKPRPQIVRRRSFLRASAIRGGAYYQSEPRLQPGREDPAAKPKRAASAMDPPTASLLLSRAPRRTSDPRRT